jgi:pimeloyl-ACP methyl ester carboxylesterase
MKAKVNGIEVNYEIHGKEGRALAHLQPFARLQPAHVGSAARRVQGPLSHPALRHARPRRTEAPKGAYTLDMLAEDLRQLLAELKIKRTHYCGLSMGGMIGQVVALTDPGVFDRVVLADTGHTQTPETKKQWEERINTAQTRGMQPLVEPTIERWFTKDFRGKPIVDTIRN